jgi:hypothetical protein
MSLWQLLLLLEVLHLRERNRSINGGYGLELGVRAFYEYIRCNDQLKSHGGGIQQCSLTVRVAVTVGDGISRT